MTNRTSQRPRQGNNQNGSNNIIDNIISVVIIIGILVGGFFYVKANEVKSLNDFLLSAKGTVSKLKTCLDTDEITDCISDAFSNATGKNPKKNTGDKDSKESADSAELLETLETITISEPEDKEYDRAEYKHWTTKDSGCTTREEALRLQGQNVVTADDGCKVISGEWFDWYGGELTITNPSELELDHVVPLSYANSHGAAGWDKDKKEEFANDLTTQLVLVSAKENRTKSDSGASKYMPPNESYHCRYAYRWIKTVDKYDLSITEKDKEVLEEALHTC